MINDTNINAVNRFAILGNRVKAVGRFQDFGIVKSVKGTIIESIGPALSVGALAEIRISPLSSIHAQVVGFSDNRLLLMPFKSTDGVAPGSQVFPVDGSNRIPVSERLLGKVVNAFGESLDGTGNVVDFREADIQFADLFTEPPNPLTRRRITSQLHTGVRCIDTLLTVGVGQRVALMAGSGVGKSTLLGMIARFAMSDINIIALIGERGREVREFIEKDLGEDGLKKSVVVVATGDSSPLVRVRAAYLATSYAEYFRSKGKTVSFMLDSVTRFAMAQREIGLSVGEPPSTKGYTPSVFATLPKLLERTGLDSGPGGITAFYTVLVEGDDLNEPVSDSVRGIVDGHIVLDRAIASKGHFPAINILDSISRVMSDVVGSEHAELARKARSIIAVYRDVEDLISIGAYQKGLNPETDYAVDRIGAVLAFNRQLAQEHTSMEEALQQLAVILS